MFDVEFPVQPADLQALPIRLHPSSFNLQPFPRRGFFLTSGTALFVLYFGVPGRFNGVRNPMAVSDLWHEKNVQK